MTALPELIDTDTGEVVSAVQWNALEQTISLTALRNPSRSHGARLIHRNEPMRVVYWAEDSTGQAVYVGATASGTKLRGRVREHIGKQTRFGKWLVQNPEATLHFISFPDRATTFRVEREMIALKRPVFNER